MDSGSVEMRELTESLEQLSVWASRADYNHWNTWQTCVRILTDFAVNNTGGLTIADGLVHSRLLSGFASLIDLVDLVATSDDLTRLRPCVIDVALRLSIVSQLSSGRSRFIRFGARAKESEQTPRCTAIATPLACAVLPNTALPSRLRLLAFRTLFQPDCYPGNFEREDASLVSQAFEFIFRDQLQRESLRYASATTSNVASDAERHSEASCFATLMVRGVQRRSNDLKGCALSLEEDDEHESADHDDDDDDHDDTASRHKQLGSVYRLFAQMIELHRRWRLPGATTSPSAAAIEVLEQVYSMALGSSANALPIFPGAHKPSHTMAMAAWPLMTCDHATAPLRSDAVAIIAESLLLPPTDFQQSLSAFVASLSTRHAPREHKHDLFDFESQSLADLAEPLVPAGLQRLLGYVTMNAPPMQLYSALGIFVSTLDETEASEDFLQLEQHVREEWLTRALANAVSLAYHVAPDEERPPHNDDDEDDEDEDDDDDGDEAADASDEAPDATDEDTPSLLRGLSLQAQTNVCKRLLAFIASNEHLVRLWTTQPELQLIASQAGIPTNAADLRTLSRLLQCSPDSPDIALVCAKYKWHELGHAYGKASGIPSVLRSVVLGDTDGYDNLHASVVHQGSRYSATPVVVEVMSHFVGLPATPNRTEMVEFLQIAAWPWFDYALGNPLLTPPSQLPPHDSVSHCVGGGRDDAQMTVLAAARLVPRLLSILDEPPSRKNATLFPAVVNMLLMFPSLAPLTVPRLLQLLLEFFPSARELVVRLLERRRELDTNDSIKRALEALQRPAASSSSSSVELTKGRPELRCKLILALGHLLCWFCDIVDLPASVAESFVSGSVESTFLSGSPDLSYDNLPEIEKPTQGLDATLLDTSLELLQHVFHACNAEKPLEYANLSAPDPPSDAVITLSATCCVLSAFGLVRTAHFGGRTPNTDATLALLCFVNKDSYRVLKVQQSEFRMGVLELASSALSRYMPSELLRQKLSALLADPAVHKNKALLEQVLRAWFPDYKPPCSFGGSIFTDANTFAEDFVNLSDQQVQILLQLLETFPHLCDTTEPPREPTTGPRIARPFSGSKWEHTANLFRSALGYDQNITPTVLAQALQYSRTDDCKRWAKFHEFARNTDVLTVADVLFDPPTAPPLAINAQTTIAQTWNTLLQSPIRAVPIMAENKFRSIGGVVTSLQLLVLAKNAIEQLLGLEPGQLATVVERAGDRFALSTWRSASVWDIMNVQKTFVKKPHLQQTVNSHAIEYGFTDMAGWSAENTVLKVIEKLGAPQYLAGRATNVALTHPQPRFGNGEEKSLACNGLLTSSQLLKYICKRFDEDTDFTYCISTSNVPENAIYQKFRKTAHTTPVAEVVLRFATLDEKHFYKIYNDDTGKVLLLDRYHLARAFSESLDEALAQLALPIGEFIERYCPVSAAVIQLEQSPATMTVREALHALRTATEQFPGAPLVAASFEGTAIISSASILRALRAPLRW